MPNTNSGSNQLQQLLKSEKNTGRPIDFGRLHESIVPTKLSWLASLEMDHKRFGIRKTSIICTIGPKSASVEMMVKLRKAGMNIVRLNFSHGTHEYHAGVVKNARDSFKEFEGRPVAIALDTKGPEIRTGTLKNPDGIIIKQGQELIVTTDDARKEDGDEQTIYLDYKNLPSVVKVGGFIYIDDGILSLSIIEVMKNSVRVRANNTHKLLHHKGVNLPGTRVDLPAVSEKDIEDLGFAIKHNVDMIFASFIRKAEDVKEIRKILGEPGKHIKIISKIESQEGVNNFNSILAESDGIMVARGDLGIEIPPEKVFLAQKMIIARCNIVGKPVICATQMLESMTHNPRPTRAEVSDVSNAVLDGSDCVMLSAETASGAYPIEAVQIMHKIVVEAEATISYVPLFEELRLLSFSSEGPSETIACSAVNASFEDYIKAIIVLSTSGITAAHVAKFRPQVPIIMVTRNQTVSRQIHLNRGCYPLFYDKKPLDDWQADVDERINYAMEESKRMNLLESKAFIVAIQGWTGGFGNSNTLRILQVP